MPCPRVPGPAAPPAPRPTRRRGPGHRPLPGRAGKCTVWNMIDVTRQSTAPADRLWAVLSDVRRWPQWLPTVDAVTPLEPDRPDEVGASYTVEQPGLPRAVWTMTAIEPGRSFTWESARPGIRTVGTHTLTPADWQHHHRAGASQWSGVLAPLIRLRSGARAWTTSPARRRHSTAPPRRRAGDRAEDATDGAGVPNNLEAAGHRGPHLPSPPRRVARPGPRLVRASTASATPACAPSRPASAPATGC